MNKSHNRSRSKGKNSARIERQIQQLQSEVRTNAVGTYKLFNVRNLPAYTPTPKISRRIRIQNNLGVTPWKPTFTSIIDTLNPQCRYFQLQSLTIYGPLADPTDSGEITCNTYSGIYISTINAILYNWSADNPQLLRSATVGSRAMCKWHWDSRNSGFIWNADTLHSAGHNASLQLFTTARESQRQGHVC